MIIRLRWKQPGEGVRETARNVVEIPRRSEVHRVRTAGAGEVAGEERQLVTSEEMARGLSALLWPASTVPMALALWRMGADIGFAKEFFLQGGMGSKWQVWFALSLSMMAAARRLAQWRASEKKTPVSARQSALEVVGEPTMVESVVGEQADGHAGWRFGNLR